MYSYDYFSLNWGDFQQFKIKMPKILPNQAKRWISFSKFPAGLFEFHNSRPNRVMKGNKTAAWLGLSFLL